MDGEKPQGSMDKLEPLAQSRFGALKLSELTLVRVASNAPPKSNIAQCGPSLCDKDPKNDPSKARNEWGREREISAEVIRWLCVEEKAKHEVDPKGIWVYGAKITGKLDLSSVNVPFPIVLHHCRLMENADLHDAQLPYLDLEGSWVPAINADGLHVEDDVYLNNGFHADGEVRLLGAHIGGDLDCSRGTFTKSKSTGYALSADNITVHGNVFLSDGFQADGDVRLPAAQIGGDLDCTDSAFSNLLAGSATVKGDFRWQKLKHPDHVILNVINTSVGSIIDEEKSWPAQGNLSLDGLVYGRITAGPTKAETRLDWLSRQVPFTPQPYRQLAKVLSEAGDDAGARTVRVAMENRKWKARGLHSLSDAAERWIAGPTIGYGYQPLWAIAEILGLSAIGWIIYRRSYLAGNIVPTEKDGYESFKCSGQPPPHYTPFAPLVYSVENSLPLVKLGQEDTWHPEPDRDSALSRTSNWPTRLTVPRTWTHFPWIQHFLVFCGLQPHPDRGAARSRPSRWFTSPRFVRWFLWIHILLGWLLATLFLAGVTGIVRKD